MSKKFLKLLQSPQICDYCQKRGMLDRLIITPFYKAPYKKGDLFIPCGYVIAKKCVECFMSDIEKRTMEDLGGENE